MSAMSNNLTFCRIDLSKTNYLPYQNSRILSINEKINLIDKLKDIYVNYCRYKKFQHPMPIFDSQITDPANDIIIYIDANDIVAFSLVHRYDTENVESVQFAWDYRSPKLKLGIKSIETECYFYKMQGFKFLYLGIYADYKKNFNGFELLNKFY